ncbi:MAG: hypothetical protein FJ302_11950 [Planctomycetes bacterium]|nr:hypothetical protein [Planctomycetota bacterium]
MRKAGRFEETRRRALSPVRVDVGDAVEEQQSETVLLPADDSLLVHPHHLEQEVRHRLMQESNLNFTSLVVRRVRDGLCLEGVLEANDSDEVSKLVSQVCGAIPVLNHLVVHSPRELPRKG